ncbi:hypothetical protein EVAR_100247_1 [Eumeta japonica]|uniref:Uncharacterized protein n=1 Tax=Eumeta variegata TaxID=151549 RepID=A0A4C2A5R1_EUMVA|nr:hypothetical protein EVAR_100247_1 [Eumeta japonica]
MSALLDNSTRSRLIVQKMEIKTETDDVDEGRCSRPTRSSLSLEFTAYKKNCVLPSHSTSARAATVYERSPIAAG